MKEARVVNVRYVALAVTDFEPERTFFSQHWGLRQVDGTAEMAYFAAEGSGEPFVLRLRKDASARLEVLGLAARTRRDVDALYQRLRDLPRAKVLSAPHGLLQPGGGYGFRCFDLDGRLLEISADVTEGPKRELRPGEDVPVRLSHVVLHSPDVAATVAFYTQLGFRISDWLGQFMCFLRCDAAHHRLAILPGGPGFNHVAFDMRGLDEMMRGLARLVKSEVQLEWGPGRHTAGNNTFAYFRSPNGFSVEYTAELEQVDDATWCPNVYPLTPEVTDQWGTGRLLVQSGHASPPPPDAGAWQQPPV